jgi:hypothetical protein
MAGTFLPHICVKVPKVQPPKDFGENTTRVAHCSVLETAHKQYLNTLMANSIRAKADNVKFFEVALATDCL